MATPTAPTPSAAPAPPPRDDWAVQAADSIDRVISGIGDKTARPLTTVAAVLVYGLVALTALTALAVLLSVMLVRISINYLPFDDHARAVWVSEAAVGGIFTLAGLFLWRKRRPKNN